MKVLRESDARWVHVRVVPPLLRSVITDPLRPTAPASHVKLSIISNIPANNESFLNTLKKKDLNNIYCFPNKKMFIIVLLDYKQPGGDSTIRAGDRVACHRCHHCLRK